MLQLWLKFKDENGDGQRLTVEGESFTVGRHSENDLIIADSRLSREHIRIKRADGEITVSDSGSSNGTTINGEKLDGQKHLKDKDVLDLGGGLRIEIDIEETLDDLAATPLDIGAGTPGQPHSSAPVYSPAASPTPSNDGIPVSFFVLAPLLGLLVLVLAIGVFYLFSGSSETDVADSGDDINYPTSDRNDDDKPIKNSDNTPKPLAKSPSPSAVDTPANGGTPTTPTPGTVGTEVPPVNLTETAKVEQNGAAFMRLIAKNDKTAFLTGDQAQKVNAKVKQIGKSGALAENINAARKNASQIKSLAASKNLKPQFLAVAAITKLGGSRGDIMQAAQSVADVYDKLATQIGNERGDDSLLMVAAFDQGVAGETMKMRNMLQDLATKSSESVRTIRSIWFLEKNGKISQGEFDRALNFLAIGTITQNPKEFGVNVEVLAL